MTYKPQTLKNNDQDQEPPKCAFCRSCGRHLRNPNSLKHGYGPRCYKMQMTGFNRRAKALEPCSIDDIVLATRTRQAIYRIVSRLNKDDYPQRWTCNICQDDFFYQLLLDGGISILRYLPGFHDVDFPYENYPDPFPGTPVRLVPLTVPEQALIRGLNRDTIDFTTLWGPEKKLDDIRHQVGGEPRLIQEVWKLWAMQCPSCGQEMDFLASIADNNLDSRGFAGYGGVQTGCSYCPDCHIVGVVQRVD